MTPDVQRWFDGTDWTEHTRPLPEAALRPAAPLNAVVGAAVGAGAGTGIGDRAATGSAAGGSWQPAQSAWVPGEPIPGLAPPPEPPPVSPWAAAPASAPWAGGTGASAFGTTSPFGAALGGPGGWAPGAGSLLGEPAHWGWRVLATLLDQILTTIPYLAGILYLQITSVPGLDAYGRFTTVPTAQGVVVAGVGALVTLVLWFVSRVVQQGRTGQSWGKRIVGLRTVHETTDQPLGMWWAFVRDIAHVVNAFLFYLGYLWPLWDQRRQAFSDKLTHAVVLRDPH
ncbi:hypothetical protein Cph01nite_24380 [Cellulomonas phragmiteti]|uniref:RDD domain-containing protein n=1 Tax=Cellulomonas phragmiteti TaxID=478780 RepID=A0ABQ4DMV7_9CELL|nr:hypothetical protein Cph01nite_24380 [Cellulomonas phragmiteti]